MINRKRRATRCAARIASKDVRAFVPHAFEGGCTDCVMVVYLQHLLNPDDFTVEVVTRLYNCLQGTCLHQVQGLSRTKIIRLVRSGADKDKIKEAGIRLFVRMAERHPGCMNCVSFATFFVAACMGYSQGGARKKFSVG